MAPLWLVPVAVLAMLVWRAPAPALEHGSLVIAMPVASGWVVCGDKRKNSNLVEATEDEVKVFALAPGVVVGATGLRRVKESTTLFDVADATLAFHNTRAFDGKDDYVEALAKYLSGEFIRTVPTRIWPDIETTTANAPSVFTVMLFWTTKAGLPRWADVNFHLRGGPRYASRTTWDVLATGNKIRPVTIGNLAVVDELQHGYRPDFGDARRDPEIRRFLIAPYLWRERMAEEAERFGRRLIELTSARLPALQSRPSDVGPVADCLRIDGPGV
jgi:hypothetical protein